MNRPLPGKRIHLIRWSPAGAGWASEVRTGRYVGGDDADWLLEIDGEPARFPRDVWQRFVPQHDQPPPRQQQAEVLTIPTTSRPLMEPHPRPDESTEPTAAPA